MSRVQLRFRTARHSATATSQWSLSSPFRGRHPVEWRQKSMAGCWFIPKVGRRGTGCCFFDGRSCDSNLSCWNRNEYFFQILRILNTYVIHIYIYSICWVHKSGITWRHTFLHSFRDHSSCGVTRRRGSHLVASWSQDVTGCHWPSHSQLWSKPSHLAGLTAMINQRIFDDFCRHRKSSEILYIAWMSKYVFKCSLVSRHSTTRLWIFEMMIHLKKIRYSASVIFLGCRM